MKKIIIFAVAIATFFAFSSCQKEALQDNESTNGVRIITAEFENNATKTELNDGVTPEWTPGDVIRILNVSTYQDVVLVSGETPPAEGKGIIKDGKIVIAIDDDLIGTLYAVYPASATTMESCDGNITFTIPTEQDGNFGSANICVAKSTEYDENNKDNLIFRNATAVLKIPAVDGVVGVKVTASNNIAGTVTAYFDGTEVKLNTSSIDKKYVSAVGTSAPSGNVFYLAVAPGETGDATVNCYKSDQMSSKGKDNKELGRNVIYSIDLSSSNWKTTTIADILPLNFPKAEEGTSEPPTEAWINSACSCYLSSDSSNLVFYNSDTEQKNSIGASQTVSLDGDGNFIYTSGTVTVTFSGLFVTKITFTNTGDSTWDGDYQESGSCIAAGTMITMENGGQKVVEEIEIGDVIRTVDHETGNVSSAPVCFIWKTENASNAFTLTFEGGTEVKVIEEHGFYDQEERKYAFINAQNAKDYIGHHFYDADNDRWLELKSCKTSNESVDAYAIIASGHLNHLSNGMLSMCDGSIKVLANIFEYDEQMRFDADKKAADIAAYGLTPLKTILEYKGFLEADYYDYNLQYLNVAIGKGLTTWDRVKAFSDYCEANGIY